jgi:outer membrane receptor for ferrienterochelin and colicins
MHAATSFVFANLGLIASIAWLEVRAEFTDFKGIYGGEQSINLATGYNKPIKDIPAVATVVTAADIERMGVRTLAQALERVPGLQVVAGSGRVRLLNVRGLFGDLGPDVLIKRNGVPISQGSFSTFNPFDLLPVNNIERIEVIRGPNSALDGADAFAGVVNIVTKSSTGFKGTELGGRAGNFGTYDLWVNHGTRVGPVDIAFGFSGWTTQGHQRILETDVQSQLDRLSGLNTSLAPSPLNTTNDGVDLELKASTGPWLARVGYFGVLHSGIGAGTAQVIDPEGDVPTHNFNVDINYNERIGPDWEVTGLLSYVRKWESLSELARRPGSVPGFPEGIKGSIANLSDLFRGELAAIWSNGGNHKIRIHGGAYARHLHEPVQTANAQVVTLADGRRVAIPLGGVRQLQGNELAFPDSLDTIAFGSVLDEWRLAKDWTLITALRFDGFSSTGLSVTPRVSLMWDAGLKTTLKFLYGRGFRPPTYLERLARPNQSLAVGNPDLGPQNIDTYEVQLTHTDSRYTFGFNVFGFQVKDRITSINRAGTGLTFINRGEETGYGFEMEGSWAVNRWLTLFGNFSFRDSPDPVLTSIGAGAKQLVFVEARSELMPNLYFDTTVRAVIDRDRREIDPRPPIGDYAVLNFAIQYEKVLDNVDLEFTMRNALDSDVRDISSDNGLNAVVPLADTQLAGREFWGGIKVRF